MSDDIDKKKIKTLITILQGLEVGLKATIKHLSENSNEFNGRDNVKEVPIYKRDKAELITCKEAAELYPIGEQKFRELCSSTNKDFPSLKVGYRHYIIKNKLDEWFIENKHKIF